MWTSWSESVAKRWSCCIQWRNSKRNQHRVTEDRDYTEEQLPSGIKLEGSNLSPKQAKTKKFNTFLWKWKNISSSTGLNDFGICYLVKHAINLSDETPFKEPHRRISPALFQEVREHTKEMLEVGAIRTSTSSFSSNVVVVRKKGWIFPLLYGL